MQKSTLNLANSEKNDIFTLIQSNTGVYKECYRGTDNTVFNHLFQPTLFTSNANVCVCV